MVECLLVMREALALISTPHGLDVVANTSTQEVKTEGPEVQGHPCMHSEFEGSLGYVRQGLKKEREYKEKKDFPGVIIVYYTIISYYE